MLLNLDLGLKGKTRLYVDGNGDGWGEECVRPTPDYAPLPPFPALSLSDLPFFPSLFFSFFSVRNRYVVRLAIFFLECPS